MNRSSPPRPDSPWWELHLWQIRPLRDVLWVLLALTLLWLAYYLRGITTPVLLALVLAYLFHPLTLWIERRGRMSRPLAVTALMVVLGLGVAGIGAWVGPLAVKQGVSLYDYFTRTPVPAESVDRPGVEGPEGEPGEPGASAEPGTPGAVGDGVDDEGRIIAPGGEGAEDASSAEGDGAAGEAEAETAAGEVGEDEEWKRDVPAFFHERLQGWFQRFQEDPTERLLSHARLLLTGTSHAAVVVSSIMGTTTYLIVAATLFMIFFVVFLVWMDPIFVYCQQFIPLSRRERVFEILWQMDELVSAFFRGRVLVGLLLGALLALGWMLAGVPYWLVLGLLGGLLSIIPYAAVLVWVLAVALKWLAVTSGAGPEGFDFWMVLFWPSMVFFVAQVIEGWLLTPWIQGRSVGMHAATVLLVVLVGGVIGGLFGLLLAVPVAGCLKILFQEVALPRIRAWAAAQ